jgi:hypothetical protein
MFVISEGEKYRDIKCEACMIILVTQFWAVIIVVCFVTLLKVM